MDNNGAGIRDCKTVSASAADVHRSVGDVESTAAPPAATSQVSGTPAEFADEAVAADVRTAAGFRPSIYHSIPRLLLQPYTLPAAAESIGAQRSNQLDDSMRRPTTSRLSAWEIATAAGRSVTRLRSDAKFVKEPGVSMSATAISDGVDTVSAGIMPDDRPFLDPVDDEVLSSEDWSQDQLPKTPTNSSGCRNSKTIPITCEQQMNNRGRLTVPVSRTASALRRCASTDLELELPDVQRQHSGTDDISTCPTSIAKIDECDDSAVAGVTSSASDVTVRKRKRKQFAPQQQVGDRSQIVDVDAYKVDEQSDIFMEKNRLTFDVNVECWPWSTATGQSNIIGCQDSRPKRSDDSSSSPEASGEVRDWTTEKSVDERSGRSSGSEYIDEDGGDEEDVELQQQPLDVDDIRRLGMLLKEEIVRRVGTLIDRAVETFQQQQQLQYLVQAVSANTDGHNIIQPFCPSLVDSHTETSLQRRRHHHQQHQQHLMLHRPYYHPDSFQSRGGRQPNNNIVNHTTAAVVNNNNISNHFWTSDWTLPLAAVPPMIPYRRLRQQNEDSGNNVDGGGAGTSIQCDLPQRYPSIQTEALPLVVGAGGGSRSAAADVESFQLDVDGRSTTMTKKKKKRVKIMEGNNVLKSRDQIQQQSACRETPPTAGTISASGRQFSARERSSILSQSLGADDVTHELMVMTAGNSAASYDVMCGLQTCTLTPTHLRKAKLMFFYVRYPSSSLLRSYYQDVSFNQNNTAQMIKWFSNFREYFYIQIEKCARQVLSDGLLDCRDLIVRTDSDLYRTLCHHYNRREQFQAPDTFRAVVQTTLHEFHRSLLAGRDTHPAWKKSIYKVIARLDDVVPPYFRSSFDWSDAGYGRRGLDGAQPPQQQQ